jgi:undecaprenyl-diphosphatase
MLYIRPLLASRPALMSIALVGGVSGFLLILFGAQLTAPLLIDAAIHLDLSVLGFLNRFARRSPVIDTLIWRTNGSYFLEGGVLMALFWGACFSASDDPVGRGKREIVISSLIGVYTTALLAVVLRVALPFRPRPFMDPALTFLVPYLPHGVSPSNASTSFPSGHAVTFFALAAGLWFLSARLALLGFVHVAVVICAPRVYLGLHYPTDIVAGAIVAIVTVLLVNEVLRGRPLMHALVVQSERRPALFYGFLFLFCLDITMEFPNVRMVLRLIESSRLARIVAN